GNAVRRKGVYGYWGLPWMEPPECPVGGARLRREVAGTSPGPDPSGPAILYANQELGRLGAIDKNVETMTQDLGVMRALTEGRAAGKTPPPPPPPLHPEARHSLDFASVHWFGQNYTFSPTQAACIKTM